MNLKKRIRHIPIVLFILLVLYTLIHYVRVSARDLVFMDYWRNTVNLVEPTLNGTLRFQDLFFSYLGQKNFFQLLLVAFNIRYTQYNAIWESYAGVIVIALTCFLLYYVYIKKFPTPANDIRKALLRQLLFVPIVLLAFNLNQWEILSLEFSFSFMLRILLFIVAFWRMDEALSKPKWKPIDFLGIGLLVAFLTLFMSQLYFPAMIFSLVVLLGFVSFFKKGTKKEKLKSNIAFLIPCIIGVVIYFLDGNVGSIVGDGNGIITTLTSTNLYKGALYMLVASVFHQNVTSSCSEGKLLLIAILLLVVVALAVFLYFKKRLYEKTYMPLFLILYGFFSIAIITYGRAPYGIYYMLSSRYTVETTLIWIGVIWIFAYIIDFHFKSFVGWISGACVVTVFVLVLSVGIIESFVAPYRGLGKDSVIELLTQKDTALLTDQELANLQAPCDVARKGIELLKKYKLNIYRDQ